MKIRDVRVDVNKVINILEARSAQEKKLEEMLKKRGCLEAVINVGLAGDSLALAQANAFVCRVTSCSTILPRSWARKSTRR